MDKYGCEVLAFGAHPDDVEICCGGYLAKAARQAYRTAIVDLTRGEMGSRGSVEIRDAEAAAAAKILQVGHRENLNLPDGALNGYDRGESRELTSQLCRVIACLRRLRPELVLFPYPACRHPDHVAAGELIERALFLSGLRNFQIRDASSEENTPFTPRQSMLYIMRYQVRPSLIVDISEVAEQKFEALRCYASQLGLDEKRKPISPELDTEPRTLLSSPQAIRSFEAREHYYGAMIGTSHGEAFVTRNVPGVFDPVRHFRENQGERISIFPDKL